MAGAEADAAMSNGWNAMMVACAQGHAKVVARLCEAHAQVDYARQSNGFSALMAAASSAHGATCANILLQHRANVNLQDKRGSTALMHAAFHGRVASIEVLIQAGATPTVVRLGGFTALMDAAVGAHERVVQVLLKAQADPDAADKDGVTALMHAAKLGHDATMLPLLMATSAINRKDKGGKSALDHASTPAAIKRLLDAGAEMSREFRRRKKEAEEAAKDKKKILSGPAGKGGSKLGDKSARGETPAIGPTDGGAALNTAGGKLARLLMPRGRGRKSSDAMPMTSSAIFTAAKEEEVAKDYAARLLQGRFRTRHNAGNRPEARLFAMLKQTRETLPDHTTYSSITETRAEVSTSLS
jgi:hypothetical protein